MDTMLVSLPDPKDLHLVPLPVNSGGGVAVFPRYGFENSQFRIMPGSKIARLRIVGGGDPAPWFECGGTASLPLNQAHLPPGEHEIEVEWQTSQGGRGRQSVPYHVRPGCLVGEGLLVDVAFDRRRFHLARPTGVEHWDRDGRLLGLSHPPGLRPITALAASDSQKLIAIGCSDGSLFLCCPDTGIFSPAYRLQAQGQVTTLCFVGSQLVMVVGLRHLAILNIGGLDQITQASGQDLSSDLHCATMVDGNLRILAMNVDTVTGRLPLLRLDEQRYLLVNPDKVTLYGEWPTRTIELTETIGQCLRVLHLGRTEGDGQRLLVLAAKGLYELAFLPDDEQVTPRPLFPMRKTTATNTCTRFTADGRVMAEATTHLLVIGIDPLADPAASASVTAVEKPAGALAELTASAYDPALAVVALGDLQGRIALFDLATGRSSIQSVHRDSATRLLGEGESYKDGRHSHVTCLAFIPGTRLLLSGGIDQNFCCHEVSGEIMVKRWELQGLEGNIQDIAVLDENLFATTTPYLLTLWSLDGGKAKRLNSWRSPSSMLDPVCATGDGVHLVAGDWDGSIHMLEPGPKGMKLLWSLQVAPDSLFVLQCIDKQFLLAVTEGRVLVLVDLAQHSVVASCPCYHITVGNRRRTDLLVEVNGRRMLVANIFHPMDSGVYHPLHLVPVTALRWRDGWLYLDERDQLAAVELPGLAT